MVLPGFWTFLRLVFGTASALLAGRGRRGKENLCVSDLGINSTPAEITAYSQRIARLSGLFWGEEGAGNVEGQSDQCGKDMNRVFRATHSLFHPRFTAIPELAISFCGQTRRQLRSFGCSVRQSGIEIGGTYLLV